ncbi:hypothetical protein KIH74_31350 [Kineosporia sp. J2-2]|uniref:ATP-grasp domain-containing protein n=1 Tax=Kineosporia corallincola TaxID=2835133 RepID=A0ABS5TRS5_9ACTN|nr:hypothetical protein [Kineosporia corallincola]MBT0773485.1 hypothetical protein [Kineosporia corallincola]
MLYLLHRLCRADSRVIYLSSAEIDPVFLDYSLRLMAPSADSRRRLTMIACNSDEPIPLSAKVLRDHGVLARLRAAIGDPHDAVMVAFNGSPLERRLALALDVPLFAPDPDLVHLGSKSGGRQLFRQAGVPIAEGAENLRDEGDVVAALAGLRTRDPRLESAMVKLNDGFGASGNAVFSFAGAPAGPGLADWIARELPARAVFGSPPDDWDHYREELGRCGAAVERFVQGLEVTAPSAQLLLAPGRPVRVVSTQDQVLGGPQRQIFVGATFPARPDYRHDIQELARRAGRALAGEGVTGLVSVDFVSARTGTGWRHHAVEVNLRMGGGTAPFFYLDGLVGGQIDPDTAQYLAPDGTPRVYFATDRLLDPAYRVLTPADAIATIEEAGPGFGGPGGRGDTGGVAGGVAGGVEGSGSGTGAVGYMLGALEIGRLGVIAVDTDLERAHATHRRIAEALGRRSRQTARSAL